jgi:alginate O-acetyltransferase complex protein AlgI
MLFNSFEFILVFLPATLIGYFALNKFSHQRLSKAWLLLASFIFYSWVNPLYLLLLIGSILFNYFFAQLIRSTEETRKRKTYLTIGIVGNLVLLGYFKYADFFITNVNAVLNTEFNLLHIMLPIGISFFTFQQIAFLVDTYKKIVSEYDFLNYAVFVSFFPQILSGPISHHKQLMPQFLDKSLRFINPDNLAKGLFIFNMGLAKKIIIADTFGKIANNGYANSALLDTLESWITSFAYTVQLYFDFSGYTDMAIGAALLFNINLPANFWSPHKAKSIQEFYRKWHITLSNFMRDYIYIPLGGNKKGDFRTYLNLFLTFLIGGLWHGANWTFVFWGGLNGLAFIVQRIYQKLKINMPDFMGVALTFLFVMIVRVFFRAPDWDVALNVLKTMTGIHDSSQPFVLIGAFYDAPIWIAGVLLLLGKNTTQHAEQFSPTIKYLFILIILIFLNITFMNSAIKQDFLYFDF